MVTDSPDRAASHDGLAAVGAHPADEGIGTVVVMKVRQMFCGMHGHDSLLQFEQDRMFLRCTSCGHESPGWSLTDAPPTAKPGDARRHALARPRLIGARRTA